MAHGSFEDSREIRHANSERMISAILETAWKQPEYVQGFRLATVSTRVTTAPYFPTKFAPSPARGAPEPFAIGKVIANQYRITGLLGKGAFARVFAAQDLQGGRTVAIKVASDPCAPLGAEARGLASLRHPGVVEAHGIGTHRGHPFLVMEVLTGRTLGTYLRARPLGIPLTITEAVVLTRSIATPLAHIHDRGLVHRDVKPENVMICHDGRIVLFDFGFSLRNAQMDSGVCGTPGYMSPEAVLGEPAAPGQDVYALGVTLYALLTGHVPSSHADPNETMLRTVQLTPPPIRELRPEIPKVLARLVHEMLAKSQLARPTAASVADRLDRISQQLQTRPPNDPMRILVVDDDAAIALRLTTFLQARLPDCEVQSARSADEALNSIRSAPPDVMLLDLNMPRVSGLELVMFLRGSKLAEDCMVVSVSAAARLPDMELLHRLGVMHFVSKGAGMLDNVLQYVLDQREFIAHSNRTVAA